MRKVFLDDLPRWGVGTNKGKIDWNNSIGYIVNFVYDDIDGKLEIIHYYKKKLKVKYKDKEFQILTRTLQKCQLAIMLGKKTNEFKFEIGKTLKDDKRDLILVDKEYRKANHQTYKFYQYNCNKCNFSGWCEEGKLLKGNGCPCCRGLVIVEGLNDIPTTHPWMIDYFPNGRDEAKMYTYQSNKSVNIVCTNCGRLTEKKIKICNLYNNKGFRCVCGDGFSFGHKFIHNILHQLEVDFNSNVRPEWCLFKDFKDKEKSKIGEYDFILEDKKIIIEVDGDFHRIDNLMNGQTKEESNYIDGAKDFLAKKNGYDVIRVDYYDEKKEQFRDYVKGSGLESEFDLTSIKWDEASEFAMSDISKTVANLWNQRKYNESTKDIAAKVGLCGVTVAQYLKCWSEIGYCDYDAKKESSIIRKLKITEANVRRCSKPIEIFKHNISLGAYPSINELERRSHADLGCQLQHANIVKVLKGVRLHHKGFNFKYVEE